MAIENKIISFWKKVKLKSSDMFTLFKVGIGLKFPTHKLHVKDVTDPMKLEGVQSDTSSSTKFLVLDGDDIVKHTTGSGKTTEEVQDIVGAMFTSNTETGVAATYEDSDGTIDLVVDHDAAANFVAAEHYRWDTDISGTATINTNNITDLHGAGVNGSANQLLTDDGDGTVTSEADLLFDSSAGVLNVGAPGGGSTIYIQRGANDDNIGGRLYFGAGDAGGTDKYGGNLHILAGRGTGNAVGGSIFFQSTAAGSSGSSLNGLVNIAQLDNVGNFEVLGSITTGSTLFANSSGVIQVANQSNITGVGTISSGTWQGTAIASAYLDSDTAHLSGAQTFIGDKTFGKSIIQGSNRTVSPGDDGIAIHVDSSDITDGTTSASGTATTYNHVTFENPRLLATNSSVTTTNASTLFIKGAPIASTNQTITNAWSIYAASGPAYFGGTILAASGVTGNVTGNTSGSSGSCTGNAATATALETARNIGGVSFNGTASINLPGVNTSGNQDTSGNATTATNLTSGDKTITGIISAKGLSIDNNVSVTPSFNGVAIHVDNSAVTDDNTAASGTASTYNHISFENPDVSATNSSVTITKASTLYIKGAPFASTNMTFTDAYALYVKGGEVYFGGSLELLGGLTVKGNVIKDDDGANCILFDSSGNTAIGGDLSILGNDIKNSSGTVAITFDGSANTSLSGNLTVNGTLELGNASDTTIARSAAGKVSIEGNEIQTKNVHHHFIHAGWFMSYPYARYIPLNGSLNEQNTATASPEYVNFTFPYDGYVKKMILRSETDMGSTNLKLYKGASGATVTTVLGDVDATVDASTAVEFDFTSVSNSYSKGDTMAIKVDPTDDPDGGQNITIELVFDLTT